MRALSGAPRSSGGAPELWAGVECTVNRVGDRYGDQLERSGHARRDDDLDRLAALGITAFRQPVLWERVAPDGVARANWDWVDRRLERLRALGVRPIVTLLHHGSGPRDTSLLDPTLPSRLAEFARAVAERHPWVEDWTPVNEPLTTARFSALYGIWYPHQRDDRAFARAFLHQMQAVRAVMRTVREVVPNARLVQTEDLGRTHAVPSLAYQARFENERRWLTFDLLAGTLAPRGAVWRFLRKYGAIAERELASFVDDPCPPDVVGLNHYLTSERFLDRRTSRYPAHTHGGNGVHRYADVEAVRVLAPGPAGPEALLREAWRRYGRTIAVTECHLACTREQQMRWLAEVWNAATRLRAAGVDLRAVTAWSALGSFDWDSLLARDAGHYEPGAFDVRAPSPRPTALVHMMRDLATRGTHDHPALDGAGWWESPRRLVYPPAGRVDRRRSATLEDPRLAHVTPQTTRRGSRRLLITGAGGRLGRALAHACEERGLAFLALTRRELDAADETAVREALATLRPWAVVNAAGLSRERAAAVDDDARDESRDACWRANVCAPLALARACASSALPLVTFSSDLVFDGAHARPYVESDVVAPRGAFAESWAAGERAALETHDASLVVRAGPLFGSGEHGDALAAALHALVDGGLVDVLVDAIVSPTYVPALVDTVLDLLIDGERGVWHVANAGAMSWYTLVRRAAEACGVDASALRAVRRPSYTALASERGWILDTVENAICQFGAAWRAHRSARAAHVVRTPSHARRETSLV